METRKLTIEEKKKGVIDDYDDIAREYAEEFFYLLGICCVRVKTSICNQKYCNAQQNNSYYVCF